MTEQHEQTIIRFLTNYTAVLKAQALHAGCSILQPDPSALRDSGAFAQWQAMAHVVHSPDADRAFWHPVIEEACAWWALALFPIALHTDTPLHLPPLTWADTPIGSIWWGAYTWLHLPSLIPITQASTLAGVTEAAIRQRIMSGELVAFPNPTRDNNPRHLRRLVSKPEVLRVYHLSTHKDSES